MNIRILAAAAALAALAGSAHAERLHTGGLPVSNNMMIANNIAAGMGNQAQQQVMGMQGGVPMGGSALGAPLAPGGHPLVANNTQVATNVAAGINNRANQNVAGLQGGGPLVGLDFSGRGPLVTTNTMVNTNVAAGLGNQAGQAVFGQQR